MSEDGDWCVLKDWATAGILFKDLCKIYGELLWTLVDDATFGHFEQYLEIMNETVREWNIQKFC